ncbi:tyrosine-type recombinase/integrase [Paenibacillus macerans]|uniref:Phage integrase family protein n=1 Tax=Paenibacillus macerans TaxID=44252 RepID=A0A090Y5K3_PAEMA|nr:tyrosine-type recombinase/integrase [Paenibacillus macerans]KFM93087.1 phage integrase family protein [Paenibacillus macerans]MCY7558531.1 tyrosine-type recombinase/integrase [Paenibacillus macerans]MEC0153961.1 tyrosine-type recombinase/integrase [Paenibacillus macerans]SUA84765.1 putative tyrosine recombinase XerC-like protein [Paenibacillus macerans]
MTQMFDAFVQHLDQTGISDRTIANYKATWSKFQKWILQTDPDLKDAGLATQKDIADFKRYMIDFGGRSGQPAKPSTMQLTFVQLNAIFNFFVEQKFIPDNPVERVQKPPTARRTPKWLSRNEQNAFLREVRKGGSKRDYAIVVLMLRAGLRVHELCNLLKTEVTMSQRAGSAYIRGKGYKDREVPLNAEVRSALESYLADRIDDSPYVFGSRRSKKLSVRGVQHMVEKYRDRTKIGHLSCHSLRHTFGHDLVMAKNDLQKVAMLMGHFKEDGTPNIAMTMIYTVPGVEDLEGAVESISWT